MTFTNFVSPLFRKLTDRSWPTYLIYLYSMMLTLMMYLSHIKVVDLGTDDEAAYLKAGLNFFLFGPPAAENSPLYALWYWLESVIISDPITLYQANWGVLVLALMILFTASLRAAGVGITVVYLALSFVSVTYYFSIWPFVAMLSTALILLSAIACLRVYSPVKAYSAAATFLALAVFVRPEFIYSFLLFLGAASFVAYKKREGYPLLIPIFAFGLLLLVFGTPFGGGRSMIAFSQHYALKVVQDRNLDIDPWNNSQMFVDADFGKAKTPLQALASNPRAFLWSMTISAKKIPQTALLVGPYYPQMSNSVRITLSALVSILLIVGVFFGVKRAQQEENGQRLIILLLALFVPYLISAVLIYPRYHYAMAPIAIMSVLAGYGLSKRVTIKVKALLLMLLPIFFMTKSLGAKDPDLPVLATTKILKNLSVPSHGSILEADYGRGMYANLTYSRISQTDCNPFTKCLKSMRPTIIVCDDKLRAYYTSDKDFLSLINDPAIQGYNSVPVPNTRVSIYISQQ